VSNLIREIERADAERLDKILKAATKRFDELFSDKELNIIILPKRVDRNEQIDLTIKFLENMKEHF
jgi:hypothetical protein